MSQGPETVSDLVSGAILSWERAEKISSSLGKNAVLDNVIKWRENMALGPENLLSAAYQKSGHYDRLRLWWEQFAADPTNDDASALVLFGALMWVSGMHRISAYIQARGEDNQRLQNDYMRLKLEDPRLENIVRSTIYNRLNVLVPHSGRLEEAYISFDDLAEHINYLLDKTDEDLQKLSENAHNRQDWESHAASSTGLVNTLLHRWITRTGEMIILSAKMRRGHLGSVPFKLPLSISEWPADGTLHYPLAKENYDWLKIIGIDKPESEIISELLSQPSRGQ